MCGWIPEMKLFHEKFRLCPGSAIYHSDNFGYGFPVFWAQIKDSPGMEIEKVPAGFIAKWAPVSKISLTTYSSFLQFVQQ